MKVLVTGGAGFIGSTVCSALLDAGHVPVVLDDFSTGRREFVADRVHYEGDIADTALLARIVGEHPDLTMAIHCAALIVVPDSLARPGDYYDTNVAKLLTFVRTFLALGGRDLVFSSSASIYVPEADFSVDESSAIEGGSPYARTKVMAETILADIAATGALRVVSLRYFNPVGADPRMRTGLANPRPTHVLGKMIEAHQEQSVFTITGTDWPTRDGTGIRDYVHVWDLARAHVCAVEALTGGTLGPTGAAGSWVINLGSGEGTTVRELAEAFGRATGRPLEVREAPPRPGDVVGCFTRSHRAEELLGWRTELSVADGVRHALAWAQRRPAVLGA